MPWFKEVTARGIGVKDSTSSSRLAARQPTRAA